MNKFSANFFKSTIWSLVQMWGMRLSDLLVFFFLARLLLPEYFGLIALATVYIEFISIFIGRGFSDAIIQKEELEAGHLDTAFWMGLGLSILLCAATFATADHIAISFSEKKLASVIRWLSISFIFTGLTNVQQAILQRELAFKLLAVRSLLASTFSGMVGIVMALNGGGVWSLVALFLTNRLLSVLLLWQIQSWRPGLSVSSAYFKDLFMFAVNILGNLSLGFFIRRTPEIFIGYFLGPVAVGYYAVAYRTQMLITQLLLHPTNTVALPMFAQLQNQRQNLTNWFYKLTLYSSTITFPLCAGFISLAPFIIPLLYGEQWRPSILITQLLIISVLLNSILYYHGSLMIALGHPAWRITIVTINTVFNIIGFTFAVQQGVLGIVIVFVINGFLTVPIELWFTTKLIDLKVGTYLLQYSAPAIASVIMVLIIEGASYAFAHLLPPYFLLFLCIILGAFVYITVLYIIQPSLLLELFTKFSKNIKPILNKQHSGIQA